MNDFAKDNQAYTAAGPWDRLGAFLRISVAVVFFLITAVFFATAQDGLISAGSVGSGVVVTAAPVSQPLSK